ncbi:cadmium resistance transporter [Vagococcus carniphilus]|uniref:Cadmium resistance transporter n=1 Tax=Vagococcus carniphilus TaxID=218144 RepID=A0AAW8U778_9ENTE|nr:cadmium resistance transporter [Vagococcus carniphilus]MDT2833811.1 cadmium resistance transporter [Vagococcus carniphilus]
MIIFISIIAFVSSNVDDIMLLTLLYAQSKNRYERKNILIGQYVGIFSLVSISLIISTILVKSTDIPVNWLGIIPIALAVKEMMKKDTGTDQTTIKITFLQVAMLTIASGADNIGVYVPIISQQSPKETFIFCIIFALMIPLWSLLGYLIGNIPVIQKTIRKHEHLIIILIYLLLGIWILVN